MDTYLIRYFISFLLITVFSSNLEATKNVTLEEQRHPRVFGRIVKLYSGYKPEPIHCRGEGFQRDPVDCSAFYRCMKSHSGKYTVLRFTCGPGTIYDPETEICNHPKNIKRSECGGNIVPNNNQARLLSKNTKEIENEIDEIFREVPIPITTKAPNAARKSTVLNHNYFSANPWFSTSKSNKILYTTIQPNPRYTRQDSPALNKLTTSSTRQQGPLCSSDGFMGDNEDCRKFYRCISNLRGGFIRHEYSCSESTVWDNDMQTCNHPWATVRTNCGGRIQSSDTRIFNKLPKIYENIPVQQQSQISYGSKVSQTQSQISHGPVVQNQTQINYGNATDSNNQNHEARQNQTQISYGSAISQIQQQINYENKGVQTQTQIDHSNQASQTQTQEQVDTTTTSSSSSVSSTNSNSNNECSSSGFMGDSTDCQKFYRCVDNGKGGYTKYNFSCGDGTVWDQSIEACNHAWAVKDCSSSDPVRSTTTTTEKVMTITTEPTPNKNEENQAPEQNTDYDTGYGQPQNENTVDSSTSSSTTSSNTASTTKEPQISNTDNSNECQQSGFIGDNNNCKKFYRCVDNGKGTFTRYEFSCGEGTVWDSQSETCNHEWAVKDCGNKVSTENSVQKEPTSTSQNEMNAETSTVKHEDNIQNSEYDSGYTQIQSEQSTITMTTISSTSESQNIKDSQCMSSGFMGDNQDCKKFYRCVDDSKGGFTRYEFYCGEGTVWDQSMEGCNHEWAVKNCKTSGSSTTQSNPHTQQTTESNISNEPITTSTKKTTTSSNQTPDVIDSQSDSCTMEGFKGDSKDCTKFHRCVDDGKGGFTKYDFKCGEGTVWDQKIQSCNHPSSRNNCSSIENDSNENRPEPVHDEVDTEITTSKSTSKTTEQSENTSPTQSPSTSNNDCKSEGFYENSDDCKKFYRCVDDGQGGYTKYEFTCGDGTIWDQEITACNHENDQTNCSKSSPKPAQTTTEIAGQVTTTTESSSNTQVTTKEPENNNSSSSSSLDQCTSEGFYANSQDCKKFYRCVDNGKGGYTKYDFTCGDGTMWVQEIQACDHEDGSMKCKTQSSSTSESPANEQQPKPETNPIMQDEEAMQTTENSDTSNSPTTQSSNSMTKDVCQEEGYFGNTEDCTKFYRCVDNGKGGLTKYDFTCGEGTIWDQDVTTCNHPQDVVHPSCKEQSNSESSSTSTTSSTSSSSSQTSSTTESEQGSSGCSQEETSKKPGNKNVTCDKAGFYPDPNDCKKFYRCVDWDGDGTKFSVFHFDCGEGTIWDPALDTCNFEDSVYPPRDCSGSQSQSENVSQEPTTTESSTTEQAKTTTSTSDTTAQQSTTTEQSETTTQSSTTSQQTTQQSSIPEKTTTQKSTTTEKTTTQQSSEQTTTQQTTTSEQTTSQQSSSSEQTTTQQSTSELTTQPITTTEQMTQTQTEMQQTTQELTTQQQTTQTSNTEESTTNHQDNQSTTESEQESTTESSSSSGDKCPETDDDQNVFVCPTSFRRHPKYCNLFYQCTEDDDTHDANIAVFHCPNNTIYDESKTQCVEEKKADKKCDGEIAQRRRFKRLYSNSRDPIVVSKEKHACPAAGHYPFEKNEECSPAFLKCKGEAGKLRGYVYRCPEGYVYWSVSRRCETKSYLKDCKYTTNDWSLRWEIPVERSNVAKYQ